LTAGAAVRLVRQVDRIPQGATGKVVGFFTFPEPVTCLVRLDEQAGGTVVRVPADGLELI
jgi:hypothetical protein